MVNWKISKILQYSPSVSFLNLSFNTLSDSLTSTCIENSFRFPLLPRLSVLILNGTKLTWDAVWFLLRHANTLQELHLSLNDFSTVDLSCITRSPGRGGIRLMSTGSDNTDNEDLMSMDYTSCSPPNCHRSDSNDSGQGSSDEDDPGCFPYLRRLMFDKNPMKTWDEVAKLGRWFFSACLIIVL